MDEKQKLLQEIEQLKTMHQQKYSSRKRNLIILGIIVLLAVFVMGILFWMPGSHSEGEENAGPHASIAGTYELWDVSVLDIFGFPEDYDNAGDLIINANGKVEFPYYDGEPEGNGEFEMITGNLKQYEYASHDYEIVVEGYKVYNVYLDVDGSRVRLHVENTYHGLGQSAYYREINYIFSKKTE